MKLNGHLKALLRHFSVLDVAEITPSSAMKNLRQLEGLEMIIQRWMWTRYALIALNWVFEGTFEAFQGAGCCQDHHVVSHEELEAVGSVRHANTKLIQSKYV